MQTIVDINGLLGANGMLQIGRDSVDRLTELWGRTPEIAPTIIYRLQCPRGQEGVKVRKVKEGTFERRWPELLDPKQPFYGMAIILEHPAKRDRAILDVRSGDLSKLVIKYFDPTGKIEGSVERYRVAVLDELASVARRELRLF